MKKRFWFHPGWFLAWFISASMNTAVFLALFNKVGTPIGTLIGVGVYAVVGSMAPYFLLLAHLFSTAHKED